jgi:enterobactin synthetase component D
MLMNFNIDGISTFGVTLPFDTHLHERFSDWLPDKMRSVSKIRQHEFIAGRYCAFQAAKEIGFNLQHLPNAVTREPLWPEGILGSITHSKHMALSCVSRSKKISSIGIDAEEVITPSLSREIENIIATNDELTLLHKLDFQKEITILFSAKEALYKALFPLARAFIDFKEVKLVSLDQEKGSFELELNSSNLKLLNYLGVYSGSFKQIENTIVTLVSVPRTTREEDYAHS